MLPSRQFVSHEAGVVRFTAGILFVLSLDHSMIRLV